MKISELEASGQPVCVGHGVLSVNHVRPVTDGFICTGARKQGVMERAECQKQREHRSSAREPWLLFSNAEGLEPHQIMALYSRRMQIEQNFRDDKSPRFGFGLRLSRSRGKGRLEVLNMVAAMASLVMWLAGYRAERQCLHRHYQASSVRHKRVLSYLSLAEEVIRHEPDKVRRLNIGNEMKKLGKEYSNMVMVA